MTSALLIVDMQNDFIEGGKLAVIGGRKAATNLANALTAGKHGEVFHFPDIIITTQDWHIDPGAHWSDNPDLVDSWPVHCKAGTEGADIFTPLEEAIQQRVTEHGATHIRVTKGEYEAAYSAFEGRTKDDNATSLAERLHELGVTALEVVGIATDYCVKASVLDANKAGFRTVVLTDYIAGVDAKSSKKAMQRMGETGTKFV